MKSKSPRRFLENSKTGREQPGLIINIFKNYKIGLVYTSPDVIKATTVNKYCKSSNKPPSSSLTSPLSNKHLYPFLISPQLELEVSNKSKLAGAFTVGVMFFLTVSNMISRRNARARESDVTNRIGSRLSVGFVSARNPVRYSVTRLYVPAGSRLQVQS